MESEQIFSLTTINYLTLNEIISWTIVYNQDATHSRRFTICGYMDLHLDLFHDFSKNKAKGAAASLSIQELLSSKGPEQAWMI